MDKNPPHEVWQQHHTQTHYEAAERNYGLLRFLAEDFGIAALVENRAVTGFSVRNAEGFE